MASGVLLVNDDIAFVVNFLNVASGISIGGQWQLFLLELCSICSKQIEHIYKKRSFFALSDHATDYKMIGVLYQQALNSLEYTDIADIKDIVVYHGQESSTPPVLDNSPFIGMVAAICASDALQFNLLLKNYLKMLTLHCQDLTLMKQQILIMLYSILGALLQKGFHDTDNSSWKLVTDVYQCVQTEDLLEAVEQNMDILYNHVVLSLNTREKDVSYISRVAEFIRENYTKNIGVSEVAESVGLNPKYLSRIFKIATEKECITECRIKKR